MRGSHQRGEETTRTRPQPVQGDDGIQRWVGLGVIADNLINIGRVLTRGAKTTPPTDEP